MVAGRSITGSWAGSTGCGFEQAEHARTGGRKSNEGETPHPPSKHSFVSQRLLVGRWPPACEYWWKCCGGGEPFVQGWTHTHTQHPKGPMGLFFFFELLLLPPSTGLCRRCCLVEAPCSGCSSTTRLVQAAMAAASSRAKRGSSWVPCLKDDVDGVGMCQTPSHCTPLTPKKHPSRLCGEPSSVHWHLGCHVQLWEFATPGYSIFHEGRRGNIAHGCRLVLTSAKVCHIPSPCSTMTSIRPTRRPSRTSSATTTPSAASRRTLRDRRCTSRPSGCGCFLSPMPLAPQGQWEGPLAHTGPTFTFSRLYIYIYMFCPFTL